MRLRTKTTYVLKAWYMMMMKLLFSVHSCTCFTVDASLRFKNKKKINLISFHYMSATQLLLWKFLHSGTFLFVIGKVIASHGLCQFVFSLELTVTLCCECTAYLLGVLSQIVVGYITFKNYTADKWRKYSGLFSHWRYCGVIVGVIYRHCSHCWCYIQALESFLLFI